MSHPYASLSANLKTKCLAYVHGRLMDDFEHSPAYEERTGNFNGGQEEFKRNLGMDWYLLFGETKDEERVLEVIRRDGQFTQEEKEMLKEWEDRAFSSVFETLSINGSSLRLCDVAAEAEYEVFSNEEAGDYFHTIAPPLQLHDFIFTNLAPVKGAWFLSGPQHTIPAHSERFVFEEFVLKRNPKDWYRNNPEKLQRAFVLQKQEYDRFVKHFGKDEVVCEGREIPELLKGYYDAWFAESGRRPVYPQVDDDILGAESAGIVMDEKEGMHYLTDYGFFVNIFTDPKYRPHFWMDVVKGYFETDSIPAFPFARMRDRCPEGFRSVLREVWKNVVPWWRRSNIDWRFEQLMDFYKSGWREPLPSLHPVNDRFKRFASIPAGTGRNDPCPCGAKKDDGSPRKYKHCCGR